MTHSKLVLVAESKGGHVNNVKLCDYLERARKEWYRFCKSLGVEAVAVHIGVDFKKEVFNQDKLTILTELVRVGNTSFTLKQTMLRDEESLVVSAEVVLAVIHLEKRTKVIVPDEVRTMISSNALLHLEQY